MGFKCGIVGLPNVGKSTLFNALTRTAAAEAANYPFSTIEPNVGRVAVPDGRLARLAEISQSAKILPTQIEFVDIAGLVKGASAGEGLGNRFLGHIREVDAIVHVVRCFADSGIVHVAGRVDPIADLEVIDTELMLADLESLERRLEALVKKMRGDDREARDTMPVAEQVLAALREGKPARTVPLAPEARPIFERLQLLTAKPVLYVANVDEASAAEGNDYSRALAARAAADGADFVVIAGAFEAELAELESEAERREFLDAAGLEEPGLVRFISAGYHLLRLATFLTTGPAESRAWTIEKGTKAARAAGTIHSDFERGFICAETIAYDDFDRIGSEQKAKDAGLMRQEGRDYVIRDGDVIRFRFNV